MSIRCLLRMLKKSDVEQISRDFRKLMIHSYYVKPPEIRVRKPMISKYSSDCPPKCWNCDFSYKSKIFCSQCKTIQKPPEKLNYFDLIGVQEDYDVVIEEVQRKYRQLQTMLHPDKFVNKSEKEKAISENFSSLLNKAYTTLINPLDRGIYMLKLYGKPISEATTSIDSNFLMTIMDKNEEIEHASGSKAKILELMKENKDTLDSLTKEISKAFHDVDIDKAKVLISKMKYYTSISLRLKILKDELGIVE